MKSFKIISTDDPFPYRDRIVEMWRDYLPGTPARRLDWLRNGNPAGPSVWFLALENDSGELVGTTTIMPRMFHYRGDFLKAGILGDFMIDRKYRVFGPNLKLMKTTLGSLDELGFSFIYTIPNESSRMVAERAGVKFIKDLDCYARPIDLSFYLKRYMPGFLASVLSRPLDILIRLSTIGASVDAALSVQEVETVDERFDLLWDRLKENAEGLIGDRSAEYMRWRYIDNPLSRFRFFTVRSHGVDDLHGYAVISLREGNKVDIYDLQALSVSGLHAVLREIVSLCRSESRQAIYYVGPEGSRIFRHLARHRFLDAGDRLLLGAFGNIDIPGDRWEFTTGDRNV